MAEPITYGGFSLEELERAYAEMAKSVGGADSITARAQNAGAIPFTKLFNALPALLAALKRGKDG